MKRSPLVLLLYLYLFLQPLLLAGWASTAGAEPAPQPLLRAVLEKPTAVPGQILSLEITILVPTWMPQPPEFPTFELPDVSVRLPEGSSRPTMERVGGESWSGVMREYQLSPMVVGLFRIPPQTITVTYADPETRAPLVAKLRTKEFVFEGRAPTAAEDLDPFIAAETLAIEQRVEGDPANLEPGSAFTRIVTARLTGASPIFLPPLIPPFEAEGLAAYPKEPVFTESSDRGRTIGKRIESVTYVAEAGGRFTAPPARLRWWNLRTKQIEVAQISALAIVSRGPSPAAPANLDEQEVVVWLLVGGLLVVIAGVGGRWSWPRYAAGRRRRLEEKLASESFAFEQVIRALRAQRFGDVIRATELWSTRLPIPFDSDRAQLFEALEPLGALLYGPEAQTPAKAHWSAALASLRNARKCCLAKERSRLADGVLPSLNPDPTARRHA